MKPVALTYLAKVAESAGYPKDKTSLIRRLEREGARIVPQDVV